MNLFLTLYVLIALIFFALIFFANRFLFPVETAIPAIIPPLLWQAIAALFWPLIALGIALGIAHSLKPTQPKEGEKDLDPTNPNL